MPRRDAFSMLRSTQSEIPSTDTPKPDRPLENLEIPSVIRPLDFIPAAEPRKKRERGWEKAHRAEVATYRGIPPETHQALLQIADAISVPVDEIARAFLEYSLEQYQAGLLLLYPRPKSQRMTLFLMEVRRRVLRHVNGFNRRSRSKRRIGKGKKEKRQRSGKPE